MPVINVQIIQPLVPEYRVAFFNKLAQDPRCCINVFASRTMPGSQSLRSFPNSASFVHLDHPCCDVLWHQFHWQQGLSLQKSLRRGDVLVVCGNPRFLSNLPLVFEARRKGIATVWWGIGTMPNQDRLRGFLRRGLMKQMDVILLYTDREREQFLHLGFAPDRLFAINNAIDQEPIQEAIADWPAIRLSSFASEHGLDGKKLFLFCGRLTSKARVDLALEALHELRTRDSRYELAIIGEGEERERLAILVERLELGSAVRWLGAIYDQRAMAPWFLTAKAFVYPGYIGLSIVHAMGYGLPVVTHDNMANQAPEVAALKNAQNGLLYTEGDVTRLAAQMARLASSDAMRTAMSQEAKRTVTEEFTLTGMVERFVSAIHAAAVRVQSHSM
ncbi:MAG: glycosyltransferase family 4 protein [Nitrospira sp.]